MGRLEGERPFKPCVYRPHRRRVQTTDGGLYTACVCMYMLSTSSCSLSLLAQPERMLSGQVIDHSIVVISVGIINLEPSIRMSVRTVQVRAAQAVGDLGRLGGGKFGRS